MSLVKRTMSYVRVGKSGLKVSKIILGCMQYGSTGWIKWAIDNQEEVNKHVKFAYDHGVQTFDTADMYSNGLSEEMLGKAIKTLHLPREELVIMTKVFGAIAPEYDMNLMQADVTPEEIGLVNQHGLGRKHIFDSVKRSLQRLQVDYIDVLFCHRFDYDTPIEETMRALHDMVTAGYVRYIGMSSCYAYQYYAITNKLTPFIVMENQYSLAYREEEREMFPTLQMFGVGAVTWAPLYRGVLGRPLSGQTTRGQVDQVEELANKKGASMAQISIAWILCKEGVAAPIVGATSLKNLEDIIGAVNIELTRDEIKYLEEPYVPLPIDGHV
ncbi:Aldo/keto reductase [Wolfiporia cocos MD-104 SS10]|uniref:Aldo/keto reductase n=1 Tax=Wolfiporia cocos (strain MD-104) TaxID=742152 RepID=A0A2H3JB20_WOLCO|nr:Aldo/keto reductase [Wolfiporia cocos MD-104 SS10]